MNDNLNIGRCPVCHAPMEDSGPFCSDACAEIAFQCQCEEMEARQELGCDMEICAQCGSVAHYAFCERCDVEEWAAKH